MRIGCLQFAPQVGDVNNNLNRADSVLSRCDPEDLDLLVLPELAFTGQLVCYYCFRPFPFPHLSIAIQCERKRTRLLGHLSGVGGCSNKQHNQH